MWSADSVQNEGVGPRVIYGGTQRGSSLHGGGRFGASDRSVRDRGGRGHTHTSHQFGGWKRCIIAWGTDLRQAQRHDGGWPPCTRPGGDALAESRRAVGRGGGLGGGRRPA
eukprot:1628342-Pleurochrysis_carterae.AAC.1